MTGLVLFLLVVGASLLLLCALHDVAARTVPNRLAAAVALVGCAGQALGGTLLTGLPTALLVFALAALCWRRGWMGGGDVKLLGAAALLVPAGLVPTLLMATALSGGVLALLYLSARRLVRRGSGTRPKGLASRAWRVERWRIRRGGPMPYAVAIAGGAFFALFHLPALGALP